VVEETGVAELPAGIHRIALPTPFVIGDVNAYVLEGDPLTLVDPGPATPETEAALEAGLARLGHRIEDLELLFLSHQHPDHVGLAATVQRRSGAEVAALDGLARYLADVPASIDLDDDYAAALMRRHGTDDATIDLLRHRATANRAFTGSVAVDRVLCDGAALTAGGRRWVVASRPGHSPTDTTLRSEDGEVLIGGDHVLESISSNPMAHAAIGTEDGAALAASEDRPRPLLAFLRSLALTAAEPALLVLPGHGTPFTSMGAVIERRLAGHERRARRLLRALERPRSATEMIETLWRRLPAEQAFLALSEVLGHLDLLAERGVVREEIIGARVRWSRV
jgi:glyoxylase-like metal-dependent hydrolase (beta-lactamase superfamily II)